MNAVMESQLVHAHTGRVSDDSVLGSKCFHIPDCVG
jgi:hypothetical protein